VPSDAKNVIATLKCTRHMGSRWYTPDFLVITINVFTGPTMALQLITQFRRNHYHISIAEIWKVASLHCLVHVALWSGASKGDQTAEDYSIWPTGFEISYGHMAQSQWRTEGGCLGCSNPPTPKFQSFDKSEPNSQFCGKYIHKNLIRILVSLICILSGTSEQGAAASRPPFCLPSVLNWICWTPTTPHPQNKVPGYATAQRLWIMFPRVMVMCIVISVYFGAP
jgi:hypothetical protein